MEDLNYKFNMFRHVSPSWGKCITLQHLTIPFPSVPCAAPKVSSNERGSSTKPSSHRGASSANAVTWRQKGFCMLLLSFCLVWNVMIDDVSPLFPERLNVWWHFVILLCFLLLKDSFIEPHHFKLNLTSFTLAAIVREGFSHSTRCIHLVAPFLPVQRWMPQPNAARRSIATLLQLSQEFQQRPPSSQHPLPSPAFQTDSKVAGAQFFTWPRAFKP